MNVDVTGITKKLLEDLEIESAATAVGVKLLYERLRTEIERVKSEQSASKKDPDDSKE